MISSSDEPRSGERFLRRSAAHFDSDYNHGLQPWLRSCAAPRLEGIAMNLLLASGILEQVTEHARTAYPNEGCGLLVGNRSAERFIPMKNIAASASDYEMDPAELIHVLRELRNSGEQLIGIYHSHPQGPATPSTKDIQRAYYPEAAHLIVSCEDLKRPRVAAFRIIDGAALPIEVHVIV
jgi:proteasome lid subunit RPN8/RPN11